MKQYNMKAVVIGGAGFIGSNLVDVLVDMGAEVIVIDNLSTGNRDNINKSAKFFRVDICDEISDLVTLFSGADYVFHLAALARVQPSIKNPIEYNKNNVNGTLNVLWAAHIAGVKRVIYSASSSAYGYSNDLPFNENMPTNPMSPYGLQ